MGAPQEIARPQAIQRMSIAAKSPPAKSSPMRNFSAASQLGTKRGKRADVAW